MKPYFDLGPLGPFASIPKEAKTVKTKPKITAKQEGGDDGYCYVVRCNGRVYVTGLTRGELSYYKQRALEAYNEGRIQ